ncbi:MAG TPA: SUMF1/EgtB/PvdO family nonheme iron enzyme, partial [bacterium]|nr:SUMF1/EgtB/PvdO family nonheme iron enzyme [bacterium]
MISYSSQSNISQQQLPHHYNKAFTLIELLVVIAIIGVLSTLSVVAFNSARSKARDSRRLSDIHNLSLALEMYYDDFGAYPEFPTANAGIIGGLCLSDLGITSTCGLNTYIAKIPDDPKNNKHYLYSTVVNPQHYELIYEEETNADDCPSNWVKVPGNTLYNTRTFCVMQYEAKNDGTNKPVSQVNGTPWVSISQIDAKAKCQSIGAHLVTEDEWLTIVRNIELQPTNWSSGQIGSGYIPRGNSDSSAAMDGTDPLTGANQRTLTLSNGAIIWDIAGNVWEWTDATILGRDQPKCVANPTGFGWCEYSGLVSYGALSPERLLPLNSSWNTTQGYGRIYSSGAPNNPNTFVFLRGGNWYYGTRSGVLVLSMSNGASYTVSDIGFRCAR